jgi:hypothetical protein
LFENNASQNLNGIKQLFQEKYGVPTIKISDRVYGTAYNEAGLIENKTKACGIASGQFQAINEFENAPRSKTKCTFGIFFFLQESPDYPDSVLRLLIRARDFIRFDKIVELEASVTNEQRDNISPIKPKL